MDDPDWPPMTPEQKLLAIFLVPLCGALAIMLVIYSVVPGP